MSPRILDISGSLGLGHVTRELAIAREMRRIRPDVGIDWLTGSPACDVLVVHGEKFVPLQDQYKG